MPFTCKTSKIYYQQEKLKHWAKFLLLSNFLTVRTKGFHLVTAINSISTGYDCYAHLQLFSHFLLATYDTGTECKQEENGQTFIAALNEKNGSLINLVLSNYSEKYFSILEGIRKSKKPRREKQTSSQVNKCLCFFSA